MFLKRLLAGVMTAMMITGMCAADVSAAEKKTVTDYQTYAANLDKSAYSGNDLGASYSKKATTFKVWSPNAASVRVNIFEHGSDNEGDAGSIMSRAMSLDKTTGVWSVTINGDLLNKYYTYSVTHGKTTKETADVYAKACGVNGQRSMVVDLSTTNPDGWENDKHVLVQNQTDASVWEISVADFSSSESSGVSEANRGKYLAFTEEGTTVNGVQGASSTCVDYLKKLGVKYVQIMPFYDFGSVDESKNIMDQYNWGYDPVNYNCPEGSYSTNPKKGEVRIKECKQMIQALHNAGIGVIMDVVYNHTYTSDSWLQRTVPNYYYRMNNDGTFSNGSGCSNDTASEHLMFRKYMIDSVTYWASEYHIDGFRFDLMGLHDVTTMNSIRTALDNLYADGSGSQILMYGEAWDMATNCDEGTVLASQKNLKQLSDRIGAFDDTIRDAIKGSTGGTDGAFVQEGSRRANLKTGIAGQSDTTTGWANVPSQCVTYASCHDNLCLYDKLVGSVYGADGKYRKRYEDLVAMNKLSAAIVITSQGIPFSLGGEEFCRSKDGDENSYASSRKENMLDWENVDLYSDVIEYYRGLYKIRDAFAAFSDSTAATANSLTYLSDVPKGVMGYTINNTESGKWSQMCVIFNGSDSAQNVTAKGDWVVLADNKTAGLRNIKNVTNSVKVEAHSAVIMVDTKSYDSAGIMDDEGAVVIDYYDNKTEKLIKSQTLTGELGTSYDVTNLASTLNYDVKKTDGEIKGVFTDQVGHAKVYVEEYDGEISTVTVKFVDETNNTEIEDSFLVKNRKGEQYYTPDLPSIKNYKLVLDDLPTNGAGKLDSASKTVTYKYTRVTDDEDKTVCRVNAIYMDDSGKILDTKTITGVEGQAYSLSQNTYEEKDLVSVPEKANGTFKSGEINVVFSYSSNPDPLKQMLPFVYVGTGLIIALCAASVIYSSNKRKKRIMAELDIEED
ncbi:type I pullulanase [Ruminococcus bromii]|nr:type I pullulanase [Ruminococcus bromii]MTQ93429.1 type I pullulanase [Ruminococcus bromii]MTR78750.1 type I pullulanase [Ruminococcus bromii]MTR87605.1 type I pullulanase [Ruminococcus bromii]